MARAHRLFNAPRVVSPRSGKRISNTYAAATETNREGFPSFKRTVEEDTLSVLLCNTLSNTFYADEKTLADETIDVLTKMAQKDPEFLAKALVYARNKGLMKLAPVLGLAVLSVHDSPSNKTNFRKAFDSVVRIPDDLREFVSICRSKRVRNGLGGNACDAVKHWLRHMPPYQAVKYGSGKSEGMTLRDILRLSHPKPKDKAQEELWGWLVKGWDDVQSEPSPTNPMVWAVETIKRTNDSAKIIKLIEDHQLPWEVVIPAVQKMTPDIWKALMKSMPYMALLRNLATMERHGVFKDKECAKFVSEKISNPENVRKSKQFPFRFFNAYKMFNGNQDVKDAISDALEESFRNVEKLNGRICIANDVSGSMDGHASHKGATRYCDIAGLFAAALFKKCDDVVLLPFDMRVHKVSVSRRSTVMDIAQKIGMAMGGTDLGAPIRHLRDTGTKVDVFIGITDGEDWAGRGFLTEWESYKNRFNKKAKAVLVRIDPYRDWNAPTGYSDVHFVMGWSDAVVKYVPLVVEGTLNQVEEVRKIDLNNLNVQNKREGSKE